MIANKWFLVLFLCGLTFSVKAQLKAVNSYPITVNYDKTVHIVFPSSVKYFSSVSDFVIVDNPDNAKNIIRLKANTGSFNKKTTVSVATADGQFYTFDALFQANLAKTNILVGKNKDFESVKPEIIYINSSVQTHLILPNKVVYFDFGNPETVSCEIAENTENILRITAIKSKFSEPTNVSFVTADGRFYTFDLVYSDNPPGFVYQIGEEPKNTAIITGEIKTEEKQSDLEYIEKYSRQIYNVGINKNRIVISLLNVFASQEKVFIKLEIKNKSSINYDVDFIKFYVEDKKRNKKSVSQQVDIDPIYIEDYNKTIEVKKSQSIVFAFNKFTIADSQLLTVQINEKNGGRNIILEINEKVLSNATGI